MTNTSLLLTKGFSGESWYAIKVRTRSEPACECVLRAAGYQTFCPVYMHRTRYSDRWRTAPRALFPGYIFCRFDITRKLPIVSSPGVEYIVGGGSPSAVIPEAEVENVRRAANAGAEPTEYLTAGQSVRVEYGPLAGVEGIFTRSSGGDRLVVSVTLLQRSVSVTVDRDQVVPVLPMHKMPAFQYRSQPETPFVAAVQCNSEKSL
jgi:transcription antitermination factor NusG